MNKALSLVKILMVLLVKQSFCYIPHFAIFRTFLPTNTMKLSLGVVLWKRILQNPQENTFDAVSFLLKLHAGGV